MSNKLCDRTFLGNKLRPFPEVSEFFNQFDSDQIDFYGYIIAYKTKTIYEKIKYTLDEKTIVSLSTKQNKIWPLIRDIKSLLVDKQDLFEHITCLQNSNIETCIAFIMEWIRTASYFTNCRPKWSKSNVIYHPETEQFELFFNKGLLDFLIWIEVEGGISRLTFIKK